MAADGRASCSYSFDLKLEAANVPEILCSPCSKVDIHVPAIKYCIECNENVRGKCLFDHNKFSVISGHQITDLSRLQNRPEIPSQSCQVQPGKEVNLYCVVHDSVGCSDCIDHKHRDCREIQSVPHIANNAQIDGDVRGLEKEIKSLLARYDALKHLKQQELKQLQENKENLLNEIRDLREDINNQLDIMERNIMTEVERICNQTIIETKQDLSEIHKHVDTMNETWGKLINAKRNNKTDEFVQLKIGQTTVQRQKCNLTGLETVISQPVNFIVDEEIEQIVKGKLKLGKVVKNQDPKFITHIGDYNMRLDAENRCNLSNMCITSKGQLFLVDGSNARLKRRNSEYGVEDYLEMPGMPVDVCEIENTQLAVSIFDRKTVQFVTQDPFSVSNAFSVGDRCRGIGYSGNVIYVRCGGWKEKGEGQGHIEAYSVNGDFLKSFFHQFEFPRYLHVPSRWKGVVVSDWMRKTLLAIDLDDEHIFEMDFPGLLRPTGICSVGDHLYIADFDSNKVVVLDENRRVLLDEEENIVKPRAVCFDERRSRIIVSFEVSDIIKVFQLLY